MNSFLQFSISFRIQLCCALMHCQAGSPGVRRSERYLRKKLNIKFWCKKIKKQNISVSNKSNTEMLNIIVWASVLFSLCDFIMGYNHIDLRVFSTVLYCHVLYQYCMCIWQSFKGNHVFCRNCPFFFYIIKYCLKSSLFVYISNKSKVCIT